MDVSALKYFIVVAQTEHMSKAAEQLHITQPSLSTSIRRLEADVGYKLFDRSGRGIQLNKYGKIFLSGVLEADAAMSKAYAEMKKLRSNTVNYIRVSCSNSKVNSSVISQVLASGNQLKIDEISNHWEQDLLGNNQDLVVTMGRSDHPAISHTILQFRKLVLVVGKNHPLGTVRGTLSLDTVNRYAFCSTDSTHSMISVVQAQCPELDFHPRIAFLGRNSFDMVKAMLSGMYVAVMVEKNLPADENLRILDVKDFNAFLPIYLYWRQSDNANPALALVRQKFVDAYRKNAEEAGSSVSTTAPNTEY